MNFCYVITLTPNINEAKSIAHHLVKSRLAACVNIIPALTSVYEWEGEVCEESECMLLIKTKSALFNEVRDGILEKHSYELPAIVSIPLEQGFEPFLDWIKDQTQADK